MHISPILLLFCQLIQCAWVCLHRQRDSRSCCLKLHIIFFKSPESGAALRTSLKCTGFDLFKCISKYVSLAEKCVNKQSIIVGGHLHNKVQLKMSFACSYIKLFKNANYFFFPFLTTSLLCKCSLRLLFGPPTATKLLVKLGLKKAVNVAHNIML